jgi:hypothetical protein
MEPRHPSQVNGSNRHNDHQSSYLYRTLEDRECSGMAVGSCGSQHGCGTLGIDQDVMVQIVQSQGHTFADGCVRIFALRPTP